MARVEQAQLLVISHKIMYIEKVDFYRRVFQA